MINKLINLARHGIEHRFSVLAVIAIALFTPGIPGTSFFLPYIIALLMFINFLTVKPAIKELTFQFTLQYVLLVLLLYPALLFFLSAYIPGYIYMGLFIACITPTAIAAPVMSDLIHANTGRMVSHVVAVNLLAPLSYGLCFFLFMRNANVTIPYVPIITRITVLIFIPMILARLAAGIFPKVTQFKGALVKKILFLLVVYTAASNASPALRGEKIELVALLFAGVFTLAFILYATGYLLGKTAQQKRTEALMFGHKNIGLATWITLSYFGEAPALPLVLYIVSHHIINGSLIARFQKEYPEKHRVR